MSGLLRLKRQIEQDRRSGNIYSPMPPFASKIGRDAELARSLGGSSYDQHSKDQKMAQFNAKKKEKMSMVKRKKKDAPLQTVDKESKLYGVKMSSQRKKEKKAELRKKTTSSAPAPSAFIEAKDPSTFVDQVTHKEKQEDPEDELDNGNNNDKKLVWEPEEILGTLENPQSDAFNLMKVIASIQGKNLKEDSEEYVWDKGTTEKGKKSEQNFFMWLEAFSAHESEKQKMLEEGVFTSA